MPIPSIPPSAPDIDVPSTIIYIDNNRTDSYTATGTSLHPFKTVDAALVYLSGITGLVAIHLAPSTTSYTHTGDITYPAVDLTIFGNHNTFAITGNITVQGHYTSYDIDIDNTGYTTTFNGTGKKFMTIGGSHIGNMVVSAGSLQRLRHSVTGTITTSGTGSVIEIEPSSDMTSMISSVPLLWKWGSQLFIPGDKICVLSPQLDFNNLTDNTETDVIPLVSGAALVDGSYTSALNPLLGQGPIIRARFMDTTAKILRGHIQLGLSFDQPSTLWTVKLYLNAVFLGQYQIWGTQSLAGDDAGVPCELIFDINAAPGGASTRFHGWGVLGSSSNGTGATIAISETSPYPAINWTVEQQFRITCTSHEVNSVPSANSHFWFDSFRLGIN